ncbi:MAG: zinc ribbon domain-containing protein [Defluviitaleaceae bacterium]|nr:zinc ribbon domain-containing protein [Defluviitaleaceae bacterium]
MENQKFCQSCGMPMGETDEMYGLNADGTKSTDYCSYCFVNGNFNSPNETLEEMIESVIPHVVEATKMSEEDARKMCNEFMPQLKRWAK